MRCNEETFCYLMLRIKKMRKGLLIDVLKTIKIIIILKHFRNEAHKIRLDVLRKGITLTGMIQTTPKTMFPHPKRKIAAALATL